MLGEVLDWCGLANLPTIKTKGRKREDIRKIKERVRKMSEAISDGDEVAEAREMAYLIRDCARSSYKSGFDIEHIMELILYEDYTRILFEEEIEEEKGWLEDGLATHLPKDAKLIEGPDLESSQVACWQNKNGDVIKPFKFTRIIIDEDDIKGPNYERA